jgi:hypothetical protein
MAQVVEHLPSMVKDLSLVSSIDKKKMGLPFFSVLGFELRVYTLSHSTRPSL